jgi:hypothetical protein
LFFHVERKFWVFEIWYGAYYYKDTWDTAYEDTWKVSPRAVSRCITTKYLFFSF